MLPPFRAAAPNDKSPTEREFQNVAKLRLDMLLVGSTEGAYRACVLLDIIATCHALRVPAQTISPGPSSDSAPIATSSTYLSKR